ncbi:hypothetical protein M3Y94_00826400 [Aphelenchoides besseyi]|nr:hypothetical protein M3Y94_00826400 [Aphelenchoides besseyi]KAI6227063.1 hypothetical protein M3Y95_00687200 [Aphelenchoides besseyi]
MGKAEEAKEKFDAELSKLRELEKQHTKYVSNRRILETQLTENKMVKEELEFLVEGEVVMKLIGPTLLKQDTEEVKVNVNKRIEYIESEIKRLETTMGQHGKALEDQRNILEKQQAALKTAIAAQAGS